MRRFRLRSFKSFFEDKGDSKKKKTIIFVESLDKRGSHLRLVDYLSKTFHGHQFSLIL